MTGKEKEVKENRIQELLVKREEYLNNGEIENEIKVLRELRVLFRRVFGQESAENAKILTELGNTLKYVKNFDESVRLLTKAENIILEIYGENSLAYVTCNANLAEVYRVMKNYEKAEEKYHKAIKIYKKNNFQNGYIFAGICNNLGLFYEENRRYQDSVKWQKKSLVILQDLENSEIQGTIILSNMVKPYLKLDEKKMAENIVDEVLKILKRRVGEGSNLYLNILNNFINAYFENKSYKKTLELLEKCKKISEDAFGIENENYKAILEKIKIVKNKIDKNKMEQYVWKKQIIRKVKK